MPPPDPAPAPHAPPAAPARHAAAADDGVAPIRLGRRPVPVVGRVEELAPDVRAARAGYPVALVAMPFALPTRPSAQLGLLAAIARSHGYPVDPHSFFLDFAARVGVEVAVQLGLSNAPQLGEWLFAGVAFDPDPDPEQSLLDELDPARVAALSATDVDAVVDLRTRVVPAFLDDLLADVDWGRYAVVGFTSTFQQNTASFALARRIKERWPQVRILFGGANFDGPMGAEWMRTMPFIDLAVTGEGDRALPALLNALVAGADPATVAGVLCRDGGHVLHGPPPAPLEDLDELPVPDYEEYFERARAVGFVAPGAEADVEVPFESSRGCWWGEKLTCTFCGLNGSTMAYRSKSPQRVLDELATLTRRHGSYMYLATDNILDLRYLDEVIDPLAEAQTGYWLFYEVKTTLGRAEMRRLYDAGVRAVQPGIDSLSGHVLRLMRKGTRVTDNVNLLRWARYHDIDVYWNVLWGFPGETPEDYAEQARLMARLVHLQPAGGVSRIDLDRFSPFFEGAEEFPVRGGRRPQLGYRHTYPVEVDLDAAAYHFAGELEGSVDDADVAPMVRAWETWCARWTTGRPPRLQFQWAPGSLRVEDGRSSLVESVKHFGNPHADLFRAVSDEAVPLAHAATAAGVDPADAERALDELCAQGLVLRDGNRFLALATPKAGQR